MMLLYWGTTALDTVISWKVKLQQDLKCRIPPTLINLFDPSEPYDVRLLRSTLEPVGTIVWMIPQRLEYCLASACTKTSIQLTKPAFLIPHYILATNAATMLPMPICTAFLRLLNRDRLKRRLSSRMTLNYYALLSRKRFWTAIKLKNSIWKR